MSKLFSLSDIKDTKLSVDKSSVVVSHFIDIHQHKIGSVVALIDNVPKPGEAFFIWTINQFNAFTFIPYMIDRLGNIDNLFISTYSINIKIIDALSSFVRNDKIHNVFILISDSAKFRIPKVCDHLDQFNLTYSNVNVRYAWNHSKITLMNISDQYYVLEGSGNFSENARHEQYLLLNSQQVYEFRRKWIIDEIHGKST